MNIYEIKINYLITLYIIKNEKKCYDKYKFNF